jgi:ABC-type cobalamin transport system ATPase subunit
VALFCLTALCRCGATVVICSHHLGWAFVQAHDKLDVMFAAVMTMALIAEALRQC